MRNVDPHLLGDKMDDAVTHYIHTHQPGEHVHIDTDGMPMSVQDDGSRITVMHQQTYSSHLCRQVTEQVGDGPWGEELLDPEGRIAAIVAQLASSRTSHPHPHHKVSARNEVDTSVILDSSIRFNGQNLNQQSVSLAGLPPMQTLPPLQEMKRCETDWFSDKNKKSETQIAQLTDSDGPVLDLPSGSPAQNRQQNRKSLPHKKRISRKLKRNNGGSTPQQDLVVINNIDPVVTPVVEEEQILPDNYVTVPQQSHHISHEVQVRPILICQICGGFYGEEQVKFFHHLKQHYEPHNIIMDSPDLVMDKITNTCIVDNVAQLPDSIVELSLENSVPKTMYQPIDKHAHSNIVPLNYNNMKVQYSMANVDKETPVEAEKGDLYETLDKLDFYNCGKCNKTFRKQKQCEAHMREAHPSNTKLEDMGEFSEPEDLMAGIHVCVSEYEPPLLPHLTVDNGHVTQDHTRHWYSRNGTQLDPCDSCNECTNDAYCAGCDRDTQQHTQTHHPQPHHAQPHHTQPHHSQPHHSQPHHTQPHHSQPHHTQPHHSQTNHTQPHHTQPHHTQPHHTQSHHTQSHHTQPIHVSEQHMESHQSHNSHSQHESHSHEPQPLKILKEEVLQRIFESEVPTPIAYNNVIHDQQNDHEDDHEPNPEHANEHSNPHSDGHSNERASHTDPSNEHADSNDVNETNDYERKHNVGEREKKWITVTVEGSNGAAKGNGKRKRLECSECGRVFSHRNSLMYHMLSHAARQHACPHCDKTFFTAGALKIHKRVHNGDKPYKCDLCGRDFRQWSDLKYHTISLHSDQKHFKCEFCGKEFARKYSLNLHRRIHTGERNYKCDYCSKTFSASSYRLTHMRTHTGDRPFKCDQCEKSFRSGFDLRRHCQVHEKFRNRFEENKPKPKDKKTKTDKDEKPAPKERKQMKAESPEPPKKCPKKRSAIRKGAPNVTVHSRDGQFKLDYPNPTTTADTEPFEHAKHLQYTKFKVVYDDEQFKDPTPYKSQPYRDSDRDLAVFRASRDDAHYRENTDGKLQIFTHIEKGKEYSGPIVSNSQVLGDIRHLEREVAREVRGDGSMNGEAENVFIERLTALYNVPV